MLKFRIKNLTLKIETYFTRIIKFFHDTIPRLKVRHLRLILNALVVVEPRSIAVAKVVSSFLCCGVKFTPWCHWGLNVWNLKRILLAYLMVFLSYIYNQFRKCWSIMTFDSLKNSCVVVTTSLRALRRKYGVYMSCMLQYLWFDTHIVCVRIFGGAYGFKILLKYGLWKFHLATWERPHNC